MWGLLIRKAWLSSEPQGATGLHLPVTQMRHGSQHTQLSAWVHRAFYTLSPGPWAPLFFFPCDTPFCFFPRASKVRQAPLDQLVFLVLRSDWAPAAFFPIFITQEHTGLEV